MCADEEKTNQGFEQDSKPYYLILVKRDLSRALRYTESIVFLKVVITRRAIDTSHSEIDKSI